MNVLTNGDYVTIDDYTVIFSEPQYYTLIQVKQDRFMPLAFLGGVTVFIGLALAFYIQPKKLWAIEDSEGSWTVKGYSRKGGVLFSEQLETLVSDNRKTDKRIE